MVKLAIILHLLTIYYVSGSELMSFDRICGLCTTWRCLTDGNEEGSRQEGELSSTLQLKGV